MNPNSRVIVALDVESSDQAAKLVAQLGAEASFYKVGLQLLTAHGPSVARLVHAVPPPESLIVTPGTQLPGEAGNDQARTATPAEAIRAGSTHLVVGRSILRAADPAASFAAICDQIDRA